MGRDQKVKEAVIIWISGHPRPGGSKVGGVSKTGARYVRDAGGSKVREWKAEVRAAALEETRERGPWLGACRVHAIFYLPRPQQHHVAGDLSRELRDASPSSHVMKPDATKLWRPVEDALSGVLWVDDAQITHQIIEKQYAPTRDQVGVRINAHFLDVPDKLQ